MNSVELNKIVQNRLHVCQSVLIRKGAEYSKDDDRLSNFHRAGYLQMVEPETALIGMLSKHVVSIYDMVDDIEFEEEVPLRGRVKEKITDAINYLLLLEALIEERYDHPEGCECKHCDVD